MPANGQPLRQTQRTISAPIRTLVAHPGARVAGGTWLLAALHASTLLMIRVVHVADTAALMAAGESIVAEKVTAPLGHLLEVLGACD